MNYDARWLFCREIRNDRLPSLFFIFHTSIAIVYFRETQLVVKSGKMFRYFALEWISAPNSVTLFTVIFVLATAVLLAIIKRLNFILRVNQIPGAFCGFTIFGNAPVSPMSPEGNLSRCSFCTIYCLL
jgi:hypothetical protein